MPPHFVAPIHRALVAKFVRGVAAVGLTVALMGVQPPTALASATNPGGPGVVLSFANCFDACTVNVVLSGNGSGTWKSTNSSHVPNGLINCTWLNGAQAPGSDCTESYCCVDRASAVRVYFELTPATGSEACYLDTCSTGPVQNFKDLPSTNMPITTTIGGSFAKQTYGVNVLLAGSGSGSVHSSPVIINCPGICATNFVYGTDLTLTASPNVGSYFVGWSGSCAGQSFTCNFTVTGPGSATATFTLGAPPTPTASAPVPTPTATAIPPVTPGPTKTATAARTPGPSHASVTDAPPPSEAAVSSAQESSTSTSTSPGGTPDGAIVTEPAAPGPSEPPVAPAVAGSDLTPIALAILGAGLLIAIGIGIATYTLTRRRGTPSS